jgi:flagellar protein FliJ
VSTPQTSLIAVLEQAQEARDEAMALYESSRKTLEAARKQLLSLQDFRHQYEVRWQGQFQRSGGVEIVRCYQEFMARLVEAEGEQQRRTEHGEQVAEHRRLELIERERKVAAISQLIKRREDEQALKDRRKDQKNTDELAARLAATPSPMQSTGLLSASTVAGNPL